MFRVNKKYTMWKHGLMRLNIQIVAFDPTTGRGRKFFRDGATHIMPFGTAHWVHRGKNNSARTQKEIEAEMKAAQETADSLNDPMLVAIFGEPK